MSFTYSPPPYLQEHGIRLDWQDGFMIRVASQDNTVVVEANPAGLISLAMHLLTLAQQEVPDGNHLHYDPGVSLEDDSTHLIIVRLGEQNGPDSEQPVNLSSG